MRRTLVLLVSLATTAALLGACTGDNNEATTGTVAGAPTPTTASARPVGGLTQQYLQRYCEVLTVTVADTGTVATVWGTQGLNDCPDQAFAAIDPTAVATELGATVALPNGPRYWLLDDIVANRMAGSGEIRSFNGIDMRSIALVDLGEGVPDRNPYAQVSVERDTEFVFEKGRQVYELTDPDGSVYVMQSYSVEVDSLLTVEQLPALGSRLELPVGWTFASRTLEEALVVEDLDGIATVIQDELRNSYQLRVQG